MEAEEFDIVEDRYILLTPWTSGFASMICRGSTLHQFAVANLNRCHLGPRSRDIPVSTGRADGQRPIHASLNLKLSAHPALVGIGFSDRKLPSTKTILQNRADLLEL